MQSIYEQSGGTYHQNGDYLIPDIVLPEQSEASIGTWGRRHLRYIRENRPMLYNGLLLQNTLWEYLEGIEHGQGNVYSQKWGIYSCFGT